MKRSEMIELLMKPLPINDVVDFCMFKSEAEAVLKRIEDAGMLFCEKQRWDEDSWLWTPKGWENEEEQ